MPVMVIKLLGVIGVAGLATSIMDAEAIRSFNTALNMLTIFYLMNQERQLRKRILPATDRIEEALEEAAK